MGKRFYAFTRLGWLLLSVFLVALAAPAQDEVTPLNGDVNCDNEVNIADLNAVVDIIIDGEAFNADVESHLIKKIKLCYNHCGLKEKNCIFVTSLVLTYQSVSLWDYLTNSREN